MMEKLLPQNIEAERGVLGSIIIDPEAITQVVDFLRPDDFYRDAHRTIYGAMLALYTGRTPADLLTLSDALERANKLDDIGGYSGLVSLSNGVPTSANVEFYGRIVERDALSRRLIHAAGQIAAFAYEQVPGALDKAQALLFGLEQRSAKMGFSKLDSIMGEYAIELDMLHAHRDTLMGVSTGFKSLDNLTGGLQDTDLIILAGRPGSGKTALATNIAYNAAGDGKHVAIFSLEMGQRQLARRLMSMQSALDMQRLRKGWIGEDEWSVVTDSLGKLSDLPIWINDASKSPILSMCSQLRRLIADEGVDLVIIDYLQLIDHAPDDTRYENRVQEISKISRDLKGIAKEFNVPVLALAQLSRAVEQREVKIPRLSDLKESGGIEEAADIVFMLYRDDYYAELEQRESKRPNIADVYIAKHRNGPTGMIPLYFKANQTRFHPVEKHEVSE